MVVAAVVVSGRPGPKAVVGEPAVPSCSLKRLRFLNANHPVSKNLPFADVNSDQDRIVCLRQYAEGRHLQRTGLEIRAGTVGSDTEVAVEGRRRSLLNSMICLR